MRPSLVGLLLAFSACTPPGPDDGNKTPAWEVVQQGESLGGPILAVWGTGENHAVFSGGTVGNGGESLVYLWNGHTLKRLHPGGTETLWWLHGTSPTDVWLVGEHGRIAHFDGQNFSEQPRLLDTTYWGAMAFASDNVWVVGGMPGRPSGAPNDVVLHYNGASWVQETLPGTPRNVALLKVWGTSSEDLYVVGERGTIWHRSASGWELQSDLYSPPLADGTLFSVHGCSTTELYATGGTALLKSNGVTWEKLSEPSLRVANGLSCSAGGVTVVGFSGLKLRREGGVSSDDTRTQPFDNLHAAWTAANGDIWVVGGDWVSSPTEGATREGVIARYGKGHVTAELAQ